MMMEMVEVPELAGKGGFVPGKGGKGPPGMWDDGKGKKGDDGKGGFVPGKGGKGPPAMWDDGKGKKGDDGKGKKGDDGKGKMMVMMGKGKDGKDGKDGKGKGKPPPVPPRAMPPGPSLCRDFAVGRCDKGEACRFAHNFNHFCRDFATGRCEKGDQCRFAHPDGLWQVTKGELCRNFAQGKCDKGADCIFAHPEGGVGQLRVTQCKFFAAGSCTKGDQCSFAHGQPGEDGIAHAKGGKGKGKGPGKAGPPALAAIAARDMYGKGGKGAPAGSMPVGVAPPTQSQAPLLMPFCMSKERSITEHMARHPARAVPDNLAAVKAHFVDIEPGAALNRAKWPGVKCAVRRASEEILPPAPKAGVGDVNVRAFLVGPIGPRRGQRPQNHHALHRMRVFASQEKESGDHGQISAYGGGVPKGSTDDAMVEALKKYVKEQSGLDLGKVKTWNKLLQLDYGHAGKSTVFYTPNLNEVNEERVALTLSQAIEAQEMVEVEEEYEEEEEVEVGEDGETNKVMRKVKKKRPVKKMETKQKIVVKAQQFSIGGLVESKITKTTQSGYAELVAAADAYEELLQRDASFAAMEVLKLKAAEEKVRKVERDAKEVLREDRKRKREEAVEPLKKIKNDKAAALRQKWKEEEEGMTDLEKKDQYAARREALRALDQEYAEGCEEMNMRLYQEWKAEEPSSSKPRTKTHWDIDFDVYNLFNILDHPEAGLRYAADRLDRVVLAKKLLCLQLPEPSSLAQACRLTTLDNHHPKDYNLNYHHIARVYKQVEVTSPGKPPEPTSPGKPPETDGPGEGDDRAEQRAEAQGDEQAGADQQAPAETAGDAPPESKQE